MIKAITGDILAITPSLSASTTGIFRSVDAIHLLPEGPATAVAEIGPRTIVAGLPGRMAVSHDAGTSWLAGHLPLADSIVSAIHAIGQVIVVGTLEDGVLRSLDRGQTWVRSTIGVVDHRVVAFGQDSPDRLVALTESGPMYSTDTGRSWHDGAWPGHAHCVAMASGPEWKAIADEEGTICWSDDASQWSVIATCDGIVDMYQISGNRLLVVTNDRLLGMDNQGLGEPVIVPIPDGCRASAIDGDTVVLANTLGQVDRVEFPWINARL
jgi:hypothetical protein